MAATSIKRRCIARVEGLRRRQECECEVDVIEGQEEDEEEEKEEEEAHVRDILVYVRLG